MNQPSWAPVLKKDQEIWTSALRRSEGGPKILIATSVGGHLAGTILESVLAVALTLRGASIEILLCDSILPACLSCWVGWYSDQQYFSEHGPQKDLCRDCFKPAYEMYRSLGTHVHRYSEFLSPGEISEAGRISSSVPFDMIGHYALNGIAVGEHALAGALRFFARGDVNGEPYSERILRRYLKASLLTTYAMNNLLIKHRYECAVFHHGIYVPQGLIGEVCRREGVRIVNWNPGYRKKTFIFSHGDSYHHTMITEPMDKWTNLNWSEGLEAGLMDYLKSRWQGTKDWIWFHEKPEFELKKIIEETGIDFSKPCIGMLTSVMWDAQLHYPSNAFPNMLEWVTSTIAYFIRRPDLQLILRIHPAEVRGTLPSRQKMLDQINKVYSEIPKNIIIIPPESSISTYMLMTQCDTVIIYNTKTGVELAAMGIPVIVAGEAWIRNKGFAIDVIDPPTYFKLLDALPLNKKMSDEDILKAKKYAYHFFFRRMIPLDFMSPTGTNPPFKAELADLNELMPGKNAGFDVICDGILKGSDFIFDPSS
ncbi:MAG: capsule biosynthesis protein [Nitrospirae bacterium]|nr:capsule biosynthesis protein [Nitrospirota bacterium]